MTPRLPHIALLFALFAPSSILAAGEDSRVKCSVNEDRVWVYDSPATLNVAARLKCGEQVTVLSRENGFSKVQTADGTLGYISDDNLPKSPASAAAAQPNPAALPTLASAARAAAAARSASMSSTKPPSAPSGPRPAVVAGRTAQPQPTQVPPTTPISASSSNSVTQTSSSAPRSSSGSPPGSEGPAASRAASPQAKATQSAKSISSAVAPPAGDAAPHNSTASAHASSPLRVNTNADLPVDPSSTGKVAAEPAVMRNVSNDSSDEEAEDESYLARPASESEDPACRFFFSSYGLSPGQFQWMVKSRKKEYPSVCPAASPLMVDYVIIFTHDADSYSYNMPVPVHSDGGFSDWSPIVQYDTNAVPRSEIDKSKREYVWVFHVRRGTYDPSKFSPHRRFQFKKIESKHLRTVKDALEFIETQPVNR